MSKILQIAWREFVATIATKGFIIGILITPAIIAAMILIFPLLMSDDAPRVEGEIAIIDLTGEVFDGVRDYLEPEALARRRRDFRQKIKQETPEGLPQTDSARSSAIEAQALAAILGEIPKLEVVELEPGADLEQEKKPLTSGTVEDGGRLAVAVVHRDAIARSANDDPLGQYDLYVRDKLDDRIVDEVKDGLRTAIVNARLARVGLDPAIVGELTSVGRITPTTVTEKGEKRTNKALNIFLPAGFMILLLISVMTSGQHIMVSTIEEKSSRVVEVLLSAVSPMQLLAGKIIGQMCVGLTIIAVYSAMGMSAMVSFAVMGLVDVSLFFYLFIFFLIAFFFIGSMMAAIGSSVNEIREAQSMLTPVMLTMMIPWLLWMPITRDPNSLFATIASFIPPIGSFVTLLRMSSTAPPPIWQVWGSIAVCALGAYLALWGASKVFRIGLLMHGKPPNFATLVRWIRMA